MNSVGKTIVGLLATAVIGGGGAYATCTTIQNNQLKSDNLSLTETVTQITNENKQLKTDRDKLKQDILDNGIKLVTANNKIASLEEEKTDLTTQVENIGNDLKLANQNIAILNGKLTEEQNKVNNLTSEKTELETNIQTLQTNLNDTTNRLTAKTNEYNQVCQDLTTANGNITKLEQRKTELEAEIQTLQTDKANLQTQLNEKTSQYNNVVRELETANQNIETLTNEKSILEQEVADLTAEKSELQITIEEKNARIAELESQVTMLEQQVAELQARIEELENGGSEAPVTLAAGLYETGTTNLLKSWNDMINEGLSVQVETDRQFNGEVLQGTYNMLCPDYSEQFVGDIIVSDNIQIFGDSVTYVFPKATKVVLPNSIKAISAMAFSFANYEIYFMGSLAEWNNVILNDGWNASTTNLTIHCSDGDFVASSSGLDSGSGSGSGSDFDNPEFI